MKQTDGKLPANLLIRVGARVDVVSAKPVLLQRDGCAKPPGPELKVAFDV